VPVARAPGPTGGGCLPNPCSTVRAPLPASHKSNGWERFTDAVIRRLSDRPEPVVFLLWGGYAQKKIKLIDTARHRIVTAAHPSPLSAGKFLGSQPFSRTNKALADLGQEPIDWQLANTGK